MNDISICVVMFCKKSDLGEFESKYTNLRDVALETLEKCKNGSYENDDKENINIAKLMERNKKILYHFIYII